MNVDSFLLSDYAEVTPGGKLTIVGVFNTIYAKTLPAIHPLLAFSMVIHGHSAEAGRRFEFLIKVLDQDRKELGEVGGEGQLGPSSPPGLPLRAVMAGRLLAVQFPREGPYAFEVYIDGTYNAGAVLYVQKIQGE